MTTITGPVKNVAGELADGTLKVQSSRWRESSGSDATITPEPKTYAIVDGALTAAGIDPGRASLLLQIGSSTTKPLTVDIPDVESITLHELISSVTTVDPPVATKVHQDRLAVEALVASAEGIAGAQDEAVAELVVPGTETKAVLDATYATHKNLARNPDLLIAGTITRDANGAATSAPVVWPDGSPGTYTATTLSTAFPGAVDAYTITYGSPVTKTFTQPAVTRNADGAPTAVPAIVVS